ncbi:(deoxy)nucleoside triphosphate pyrophosphohydrolase [Leifsonia sp. AG29]|uniref:(deoxy)nucleoside triphosphate pyrophosphohydrolase n=1 Tax=Leifsonia sp. AG29 TaxID=2598860 RepID=UPI00131DF4F7|nr:(deoxy)nucleoside triphosphate pyrophosphohydrolase [Leifsonia sp. AG29]
MNPIRVVAAVISDSGRVLACRRAPGKDAAGRWEFPGGKVEARESDEQALAREIREELGIEIAVGSLLDRSVTGRIELACYRASLAGVRPSRSTDHDDLRWVAPAELGELDWADPDRPAVEALLRSAAGSLPEGTAR